MTYVESTEAPEFDSILWPHRARYRWFCMFCKRRGKWGLSEDSVDRDAIEHEDRCRRNRLEMSR